MGLLSTSFETGTAWSDDLFLLFSIIMVLFDFYEQCRTFTTKLLAWRLHVPQFSHNGSFHIILHITTAAIFWLYINFITSSWNRRIIVNKLKLC